MDVCICRAYTRYTVDRISKTPQPCQIFVFIEKFIYKYVRLLSGFCYLTMFTIFQTAAKNQNKNICVEFTECNSNKHIMVCAMKKDNLIKIWYLGCWQHILVHTFGFFAFCLNSWGKKIKCISESGSERATSVCIWMRMPWKRPQTI